jgi:ribosomal-protein-alanine N-acetyltransferase
MVNDIQACFAICRVISFTWKVPPFYHVSSSERKNAPFHTKNHWIMSHVSLNSLQVLHTRRLTLRPPAACDIPGLFQLRSDPEVNAYLDRPPPDGLEAVAMFVAQLNEGLRNGQSFYWVLTPDQSPALIGTICLWNLSPEGKAEVGFELLPEFRGRGLMSEALVAVLEYGLKVLNIKRIEAWTHRDNQPSRSLLEKHSFRRDHQLEEQNAELKNGSDMIIYSLDPKQVEPSSLI